MTYLTCMCVCYKNRDQVLDIYLIWQTGSGAVTKTSQLFQLNEVSSLYILRHTLVSFFKFWERADGLGDRDPSISPGCWRILPRSPEWGTNVSLHKLGVMSRHQTWVGCIALSRALCSGPLILAMISTPFNPIQDLNSTSLGLQPPACPAPTPTLLIPPSSPSNN